MLNQGIASEPEPLRLDPRPRGATAVPARSRRHCLAPRKTYVSETATLRYGPGYDLVDVLYHVRIPGIFRRAADPRLPAIAKSPITRATHLLPPLKNQYLECRPIRYVRDCSRWDGRPNVYVVKIVYCRRSRSSSSNGV